MSRQPPPSSLHLDLSKPDELKGARIVVAIRNVLRGYRLGLMKIDLPLDNHPDYIIHHGHKMVFARNQEALDRIDEPLNKINAIIKALKSDVGGEEDG